MALVLLHFVQLIDKIMHILSHTHVYKNIVYTVVQLSCYIRFFQPRAEGDEKLEVVPERIDEITEITHSEQP